MTETCSISHFLTLPCLAAFELLKGTRHVSHFLLRGMSYAPFDRDLSYKSIYSTLHCLAVFVAGLTGTWRVSNFLILGISYWPVEKETCMWLTCFIPAFSVSFQKISNLSEPQPTSSV